MIYVSAFCSVRHILAVRKPKSFIAQQRHILCTFWCRKKDRRVKDINLRLWERHPSCLGWSTIFSTIRSYLSIILTILWVISHCASWFILRRLFIYQINLKNHYQGSNWQRAYSFCTLKFRKFHTNERHLFMSAQDKQAIILTVHIFFYRPHLSMTSAS